MKLAILGREPSLSIAELEALASSGSVVATNNSVALLAELSVPLSRLGGTIKLAEVVDQLETDQWSEIAHYLTKHAVPEEVFETDDKSKKRLGVSVYGLDVPQKSITGLGLELKKKYKKAGWSIGVVPNKSNELSSAQVLHNRLDQPDKGREIIIARLQNTTYIALTTEVQDIDAYSDRDFERPARDAYVGMLPPKLAQIIVNLSAPEEKSVVLDPFCGTGVVLQEALLANFAAYGTDISPKMIDYTTKNLEWLRGLANNHLPVWHVEQGDATNHLWSQRFDRVASELYLGEPQSTSPSRNELDELRHESHELIMNFAKNIFDQAAVGTRFCIAVPAWRHNNHFESAVSVDDLQELGYTPIRFKHAESSELLYARPDQIVGRKLLVFTKE